MKRIFFSIIGIFFIQSLSFGQVFKERKTQYRFAQTYTGFNLQYTPSAGQLFLNNETEKFPSVFIPRFTIGGLHFWGKLDFKLSFAIAKFGDFELNNNTILVFKPGGDFSARFYPWRIDYFKIRPFCGIALNHFVLGLIKDAGNRHDFHISTSAVGGFSFAFNNWQINAEAMFLPFNSKNFFIDKTVVRSFKLPQSYFSFGLIRYFDITLRQEKKTKSFVNRVETELKSTKRLNSFSVGAAPSASYFFKSPFYTNGNRLSIPRHKLNFNWDLGVGYLFATAGVHAGVSYRDYTSRVESYGLKHLIQRTSVSFEGFKFLLNYHGFVPFLGPSLSFENWKYNEFAENQLLGGGKQTKLLSPGIIFGWDIVPSAIDTWTLRANLRYFPFQKIVDLEGNYVRVDQFEFNFIQLVIYPNRILNVKKIMMK